MIADELVEEIRAQADIAQIVGEHVQLRRSGRTYRGACPLHGGEGPNFSVDPDRGVFKCFVCGEGGDVFAFPMKLLGLDFLEAVRFVAERTGIPVPDVRTARPEEDPFRDIREAVAFAAEWFQGQLWEAEAGGRARRYLLIERALPEDAVRHFGLGLAPDGWRGLREAAAVHGISDDVLVRGGLAKQSERAKEPYDVFRGRLIFPIYDLRGRPSGFGGRLLGASDDSPKYINSPDSPIFHKGKTVYGLNWSRHAIRRLELAMLVEGFMDLISLMARGVENVVAPLGTAFTQDQARTLSRYAKKALLLYDSDKAGLRATFRTADELLRSGVHPSVATLPRGEDPDSIVRKGGPLALARYTDAALDVMDRKIQILEKRDYLKSIKGRRRAIDALIPTVRAASDGALKDIYLDRVATVTGVRRATLERELARPPGGWRRRQQVVTHGARTEEAVPRLGPERKLLVLLIRDRSLIPGVAEDVAPEDFTVDEYREIYRGLLSSTASGRSASLEKADSDELAWARDLSPTLLEIVREFIADPEEFTNPDAVRKDAVARLMERRLERRRDELKTEMLLADTPQREKELLGELYKITQELTGLGGRLAGWGQFKSD